MKNIIETRIREFIDNHVKTENLEGIWQEPLFAYASAYDPMFLDLRETVSPTHSMPSDFMEHPGSLTLYPIRISPKALQQAYFFVKF